MRIRSQTEVSFAEARGAESRADFIHKLGIVQKELNEETGHKRGRSQRSLRVNGSK
jgi:hypothetical protein